ncbi:MAG: O-antigen ligase family protein [Thermoleophilia bacterium]
MVPAPGHSAPTDLPSGPAPAVETGSTRVARASLYLLAALVPLAFSNFTWLPLVRASLTFDEYDTVKVFTLYATTAIGLAAWVWSLLRRGGTVRRPWTGWLVAATLGWAGVATVLSVHPATSLLGTYRRYDGFLTLVAFALVFFLAVQLVDSPARRRRLAQIVSLTGAAIAVYGVAQYLGFDPALHGTPSFGSDRGFSTMGNPSLLGGYLIFPLALSAALALTEDDRRWRIFYWVSLLIILAAWVTTFTRGAWIGGALGLLMVAALFFRAGLRRSPVDLGFALATIATGGVVVARSLSSPSDVTNVAARLGSIIRFGEGSAKTRFEIWQAAFDSIKERPLFGHGPDTFGLIFKRFRPSEYLVDAGWNNVADNAHNYMLQVASGMGVPGAILLYGFFAVALYRALPATLERAQPRSALISAGFWAGCVGYLVHLMFSLSVTGSSVLLWMGLGVLAGPSARSLSVTAPRWGRWASYVVAGVGVLAVMAAAVIPTADHFSLRANHATDFRASMIELDRAQRLNSLNSHYRREAAEVRLALAQSWFLQAKTDVQTGRDPGISLMAAGAAVREAIEAWQAAVDFTPAESLNYLNLALTYNAAAQLDPEYSELAVETARRGLAIDPHNPALRLEMALSLTDFGRLPEALALAEEATRIDPNFVGAWETLGDLYAESGRPNDALAAYRSALAVDPLNVAVQQKVEALASQTVNTEPEAPQAP